MRAGQTSLEYLLLVGAVVLITIIAGVSIIQPSVSVHTTVSNVRSSDVSPPDVTLRETEVPPPRGGVVVTPPPQRGSYPVVRCGIELLTDTELNLWFEARDIDGDLDRADVNVFLDGSSVYEKTIFLSGGSHSWSEKFRPLVKGDYRLEVVVCDSLGNCTLCQSSPATVSKVPEPPACLEGNVDFYIAELNIEPWLPGGVGYALGGEYNIFVKICRRKAKVGDLRGRAKMFVEIYDEAEQSAIVGAFNTRSKKFDGCGSALDCSFPSLMPDLQYVELYSEECYEHRVKWIPNKSGEHKIVVQLMGI
ncbi:TPA: class III signal peptide-containing protein, partial [Candidatus Micrarchaeota archaeon]|nr:class III signal peptide-containing protein [Candidatus Micrarchaeota archaeon]